MIQAREPRFGPALRLAEYNPETGALTVRGSKRGKDRQTYADPGGMMALADWRDDVLANAPAAEHGFFGVPKVIE